MESLVTVFEERAIDKFIAIKPAREKRVFMSILAKR